MWIQTACEQCCCTDFTYSPKAVLHLTLFFFFFLFMPFLPHLMKLFSLEMSEGRIPEAAVGLFEHHFLVLVL